MSISVLNRAYDAHNEVIRKVAVANGVHLLDVAAIVPSGTTYFGDAKHFNKDGEEFVGEKLATFLIESVEIGGLK